MLQASILHIWEYLGTGNWVYSEYSQFPRDEVQPMLAVPAVQNPETREARGVSTTVYRTPKCCESGRVRSTEPRNSTSTRSILSA